MNIDSPQRLASLAALAVFLVGATLLLFDPRALRDESEAKNKPYSLARVQLWWWTVIILGSYILVYGLTGAIWPLNNTCAVLLAISGATTTAGRIIDNRDTDDPDMSRHQDAESRGFFGDILSDQSGISVHRFQTLTFNVAYGLSFVVEVFSNLQAHKFPDFPDAMLPLLAVSGATYVALKASENRMGEPAVAVVAVATQAPEGAGGRSDELLDPSPEPQPVEVH